MGVFVGFPQFPFLEAPKVAVSGETASNSMQLLVWGSPARHAGTASVGRARLGQRLECIKLVFVEAVLAESLLSLLSLVS